MDALPHPDGRLLAHGAAALQQRRPDGHAGARRGARRDPVAPHQLARRSPRACPPTHAVQIALRTQQIIAEETGAANTIDPLAGSYFVEALTNEMEEKAWDYIHKIDEMGGMVAAIEKGFPQLEISDAAYQFQRQIDATRRSWSASTSMSPTEKQSIPFLEIDDTVETEQIERLQAVRRKRDSKAVKKCLERSSRRPARRATMSCLSASRP